MIVSTLTTTSAPATTHLPEAQQADKGSSTTAEHTREQVKMRNPQVESDVVNTHDVVIEQLKGGCACTTHF
jgi:hypothetical protein